MSVRKTKYDDFLYYDLMTDQLILSRWDCSVDGVQNYWHSNGELSWITCDCKEPSVNCILIDRFPERYFDGE